MRFFDTLKTSAISASNNESSCKAARRKACVSKYPLLFSGWKIERHVLSHSLTPSACELGPKAAPSSCSPW